MAGDGGVIHAGRLRRGTRAIRVQQGIFGSKDGEINGPARGVGYVLIVEFDKDRVEMRQYRRVQRVEGFVRHGEGLGALDNIGVNWFGALK